MSEVAELTRSLIERASVTPDDAGCQALLADRLAAAGMELERMRFGEVDNLLARHGHGAPHLLLLGHTDVVPAGPEDAWSSPPFQPEERDGRLYGRGAADMKGSLAAMVVAVEGFLAAHPDHAGTLSLLVTSDEEGPAVDGTVKVVEQLAERGELPDHVLVGEPSSSARLGDVIRIGRRGSLQAVLRVRGVQGHTAYADPAENPVHRVAPLLAALTAMRFDDGDKAFPPTRLQVSNLRAGTGAENVTPGEVEIRFNLRHNPNSPAGMLEARVLALVEEHAPGDWSLDWRISGAPFGPARGALLDAVAASCREVLDVDPRPDTGGGTSDGRFFGPRGIEVVELGPVNRTIHQVDECVDLADLERLPTVYRGVLDRLLARPS
ncbi:succinyl-diaminopimelate desuccinylase [Wenzhouxiangella sp. XN79A]|uniref:succinyl-diaminopimelate desuccinylase n=1 Tax=Wenzhouxiangella sp. XN79A TaxID=2724193 RepID=UPI00144ACC56|nr:succinyl-diaminopimelate desuccinylase [Wenzhouxiangella sp. XN79A]NKI35321.1 succinyl-diaminopimelate desuccinylase [Wenzhouxiangella sp. XN79A]